MSCDTSLLDGVLDDWEEEEDWTSSAWEHPESEPGKSRMPNKQSTSSFLQSKSNIHNINSSSVVSPLCRSDLDTNGKSLAPDVNSHQTAEKINLESGTATVQPVTPTKQCGDVVHRMLLNDNKAGMEGLDKQKINQIIHEASKGSKFYENERLKEEQMNRRIEEQRQKIEHISAEQLSQGVAEADRLLEDFEQHRDLSRTIVHIDMDAFYAACEMLDDPSLKSKPMAVGSNSMLSTSNYHARKFGVRAAMPGFIGRKLCPDLVIVPLNFEKYTFVSKQVKSILGEYDPHFCPVSLDEAYIDLTDHLERRLYLPEEERIILCRDASYVDSKLHCRCDLNDIARAYGNKVISSTDVTYSSFFSKDYKATRDKSPRSDLTVNQTVPGKQCMSASTGEQFCSDGDQTTDSTNIKQGEDTVLCPECGKQLPPFTHVTFGVSDEEAVKELRTRIEQRTCLTASAGIAPNMMLAKVCSDKNKPNGQYKIPATREDVMTFIKDLPTRKISGIGKVSEAMLNAVGVFTCTDLYEQRGLLYHLYSPISFNYFMRICLGIGSTTVERDSERKSMSTERTFSELSKPTELYQKCEELSECLAEDLKAEQLKGRTVSIKIKTVKFEVKTRAHTLKDYTSDYDDIVKAALDLLKTEINNCAPKPLRLRLMGVRMSNLLHESYCQARKQNTIIGAFKRLAKVKQEHTDSGTDSEFSESESRDSTGENARKPDDAVKGDSNRYLREINRVYKVGVPYDQKDKENTKQCDDWQLASEVTNNDLKNTADNDGVSVNCNEKVSNAKLTSKSQKNSFETTRKKDEESTHEETNDIEISRNTDGDRTGEKDIKTSQKTNCVQTTSGTIGEKTMSGCKKDINILQECQGKEIQMNNSEQNLQNQGYLECTKDSDSEVHAAERNTNACEYENNIKVSDSKCFQQESCIVTKKDLHDSESSEAKCETEDVPGETILVPPCTETTELSADPDKMTTTNASTPSLTGDIIIARSSTRITRSGKGRTPVPQSKRKGKRRKTSVSEPAIYDCPICSRKVLCDSLDNFNDHVDMCLETGSSVNQSLNVDDVSEVTNADGNLKVETSQVVTSKDSELVEDLEWKESESNEEIPGNNMKNLTDGTLEEKTTLNTKGNIQEIADTASLNNNEILLNTIDDVRVVSKLNVADIKNSELAIQCGSLVSIKAIGKEMHTENQLKRKEPVENIKNEAVFSIGKTEKPNNECVKTVCDISGASDSEPNLENSAEIVDIKATNCVNQTALYGVNTENAQKSVKGMIDENEQESSLPALPLSPNIIVMNKHESNAFNLDNMFSMSRTDDEGSHREKTVSFNNLPRRTLMQHSDITDEISECPDSNSSEHFQDEEESDAEGSLLVCPICNIEQRASSLNEFNDHVDSCLSRNTITQILREQNKKDKGIKRSRDIVTPGSNKAAKKRKTAMPAVSKSCRSIASFFKDK